MNGIINLKWIVASIYLSSQYLFLFFFSIYRIRNRFLENINLLSSRVYEIAEAKFLVFFNRLQKIYDLVFCIL